MYVLSVIYESASFFSKYWFKMLIEFSPIFVADTKLTFHYKFGAPLKNFSAVNKN